MLCPACNVPMIRRKDYRYKEDHYLWTCPNYPKCKRTSRQDMYGRIVSTPEDVETKELRRLAHKICEKIWGRWNDPTTNKTLMYRYLKKYTNKGHIGLMNKKELVSFIRMMRKRFKIYNKLTKDV